MSNMLESCFFYDNKSKIDCGNMIRKIIKFLPELPTEKRQNPRYLLEVHYPYYHQTMVEDLYFPFWCLLN